jgi:hypothetical protein
MKDRRKPVPEPIQVFAFKLANEDRDYALREYSDWKELETVDPRLYGMIVTYRTRKGNPDIEKYLKRTYGIDLDTY